MTSESDAEIIQHVRLMDTPTDTDPRRRYTEAQLEMAIRLARRGAAMQWRPIETAPKDGTRVLLAYHNALHNWRRVIAFYAPKLTIEQQFDDEGWCDYDEANDRFCLPEGWYECIDNWDDYSYVHMSGVTPTHWMPLPPPPALGEPEHE